MIGVIGVGYWGRNHVRVLSELGKLSIVYDNDPDARKWVKDNYDVDVAQSIDEVLKSDVKGVVIATPASTHYKLAKKCLESGKDVLVEKPMTMNSNEALELVKLSEKLDKILMVGHILLYHGAVRKMKELLENGYIGKVQYFYSNRLNFGKIRLEENVLYSFAPHDISITHYLLNEEPEEVLAVASNILSSNVLDVTISHLYFKSGVQGHIFVSWLHPYKEQRYVVIGDEGMLVFDDTVESDKLVFYPQKVTWRGNIPITERRKGESIDFEFEEPLKVEDRHFIEAIEKRIKPLSDGYEGLKVMKVLDASLKSIKENRPVKIDEEYFVHPTSIIDRNVSIGKGTKIWHFCHIMENARIGENCILGQNIFVGRNVRIGNRVKIQNNVSVYEGVEVEDEAFLGPSAVFTNVKYPRSFIERKDEFMKTIVGKGATIGANATIICGTRIGKYAVVGAGAVVTKDVPDHAIVVGNPAKIVGYACKCGYTLKFDGDIGRCPKCGKVYRKKGDSVEVIRE